MLLVAILALSFAPGAVAGTLAGLGLALFLPGYALLTCLRTEARLGSMSDVLLCGAASLAITPLALRLAGLVLPFDRAHVRSELAVVTAALLLLGAVRPRAAQAPSHRIPHPAVAAIIITTLLLLLPTLLIGPGPDGGETRVKGWDLNNHLAMAEVIASRGLPPTNPFLSTDSPFYYHTFFHILLGAVLLLAGEAAHPYLLIALMTLLLAAIFLATFHRVVWELAGAERVARFSLVLVGLVGGFDVIPMIGRWLLHKDESGSLAHFFLRHWNVDGWVSNRGMLVPSFFAGFYWVPHAVAAMVVFLLALLYLRRSETGTGAIAAAGACLASMAGYNGYVALGGAATLALLRGFDFLQFVRSRFRTGRDVLLRSASAGVLAVVLGLPVLNLYVGEQGNIDKFRWARPGPLMPLQFVLEFGPLLLLGPAGLLLARRRDGSGRGLVPFGLMGLVSVPALCLVASTGENNDLAMRVSMFLWIGLAVFSGIALDHVFPVSGSPSPWPRPGRIAAVSSLLLGSASIAWFVVGASVSKPTMPADEVAAGQWVRSQIARGRLVQGSPLRGNPDLVYLTGHPAVLSDTWAGRLFYSKPADFSRRMSALSSAFSSPDPAVACPILDDLAIAALVVGPEEERDFPVLAGPEPWSCLTEEYRQGTYRVFRVH